MPGADDDRARALRILRQIEAGQLADRPWLVLSQGERHRILIGRALMASPKVLILDEPCAGVNPSLLELILDRLLTLNASGKTILLIEHNMDAVARLCRRVVVMAGGRHLTEGTPAEVAANPAVIEAYLGGMAA